MPTESEFVENVRLPDGTVDQLMMDYETSPEGGTPGQPKFRLRRTGYSVKCDPDGNYMLRDSGEPLEKIATSR